MSDKELSRLTEAATVSDDDYFYVVAGGNSRRARVRTLRGALNITRAQIADTVVTADTIIVSGYATGGDLGAGAIYTSVGATSNGPGAIQDAAGTWFNLVINDIVLPGWFGAKNDNSTNDTAAYVAAYSAAADANADFILQPGNVKVASLIWDQDVNVYGVGSSRVDLQACKLEYSIVSPK